MIVTEVELIKLIRAEKGCSLVEARDAIKHLIKNYNTYICKVVENGIGYNATLSFVTGISYEVNAERMV